jgi:hypothetical protein
VLALTVVVAAALLPAVGVLVQLASASDWYLPHDDAISAFERRYAGLREALRGVAVVGHLAVPGSADTQTANLYLSRYTLAPTRVTDDADPPLVIADGVPDRAHVPPRYAVRLDFGNGLLLPERLDEAPQ